MAELETFLRAKDVCRVLGYKTTESLHSKNRKDSKRYDPEFPQPVQITPDMRVWLEREIIEYQQKLISKRKG